jgi:osmoprotectant transport system permease protein
VRHRRALGGTRLVFDALVSGELDVYAEYTGTLTHEVLASRHPESAAQLRTILAESGLVMSGSLGFRNNYALGMRQEVADRLGIRRISDLRGHPNLRFRFGNEFMERDDGWPGLRAHYLLPQTDVRGVEHDLAYRGLDAGDTDLIDLYTTDAEIAYYDLRTLEDDLGYFPQYEAVILYRAELEREAPEAVASLRRLTGLIDEAAMIAMNARVKIDGEPEARVAADFLRERLGLNVTAVSVSRLQRLGRYSLEHLALVGVSLLAAILIAIPLGILAARRPRLGQIVLGAVGIAQTIPALALLVFMIPLLGIGAGPAIVALFIYSLLPIVRNTHAGLTGIPLSLRESAEALGLPPGARLRLVEAPLATPSILAGIKTAAVINVGAATLGALVGAGGYGQPILTGIRLDDVGLILEGAVPAALLALAVQWIFEWAERAVVPRGLRASTGE